MRNEDPEKAVKFPEDINFNLKPPIGVTTIVATFKVETYSSVSFQLKII